MICSFRLLSATDQRTNLAASRLRMHRPALHIQSVVFVFFRKSYLVCVVTGGAHRRAAAQTLACVRVPPRASRVRTARVPLAARGVGPVGTSRNAIATVSHADNHRSGHSHPQCTALQHLSIQRG
jgi:hypothetical protein